MRGDKKTGGGSVSASGGDADIVRRTAQDDIEWDGVRGDASGRGDDDEDRISVVGGRGGERVGGAGSKKKAATSSNLKSCTMH